MSPDEFAELLQLGREQPAVEFKGAQPRTDRLFFAKVVRAIFGMANRRDGGQVILGVDETNGALAPTGLAPDIAATWTFEAITAGVAEYVDPHVNLDLRFFTFDEKRFANIRVEEFAEVPVLCRKTYQSQAGVVLREGACYVRPRRKIETAEVATYADMRDLIDLATEKSTRRFIERAVRSGILQPGKPVDTDEDLFRRQREDLQ